MRMKGGISMSMSIKAVDRRLKAEKASLCYMAAGLA